ncbi:hypothetical protein HJG60_010962 [Phyllostomus discolor]|uniref:L-amino-acid oxidase n=1 Tax=Phyllostomus discolor TaxID=89673 RepID=A0A834EAD4_9CHIR|nr:hypothetical protein HJG60_010962 [Phyllostomus discolor]
MSYRSMAKMRVRILILEFLLLIPSCFSYHEDLGKCFQDPEYESLPVTAQEGLHTSPLAKRLVVVGAGMSGLVAAKALQDTGQQASRNEVPCYACICSSLVHADVKKLGLKLNRFIQCDGNTWYLSNGQRYRAREVKANPELLGYSMNPMEKGKST